MLLILRTVQKISLTLRCEKLVFFAIFRHKIAFLNLQLNAPTL